MKRGVLKYAPMRWKLLLLIFCLVGVFPAQVQAQGAGDLLALMNNLRAGRGLPGYSINGSLSVAAQQQAQWIVDTGTVAHTHPDGSGPRSRALAAGYPSIQVSENIYGGTNASLNDAWTFWLNSGIHFQSMVSTNYQEVGIGIASGGWGAAYVVVFGGSGAPPPAAGSGANASGGQSAAAGPPAYVGGLDDNGNIKHIVQPSDTVGDIALIYGYTWSDIPYMLQLNGISNVRDLQVGSIFLVPPKDGTFTPAPNDQPPTEPPAPTAVPPTITPFVMATPTLPPEIVELTVIVPALAIATAGGDITPPAFEDATGTPIAAVPTPAPTFTAAGVQPRGSASTWIMIALGVQVVVLVGAGVEFMRRTLRKRR